MINRNRAGFTLIELIVVIAILGILAAIAIPRLGGFRLSAEARAHEANVKTITGAAQLYIANQTTAPDSVNLPIEEVVAGSALADYIKTPLTVPGGGNYSVEIASGIITVTPDVPGGGGGGGVIPPVVPAADATLSSLSTSAGTLSPAFSSSTTSYTVTLPPGTIIAPTVSATPNNAGAGVSIADASSLPGSASVDVTSVDGTTTKTYTITFSVGLSSDALLQTLSTSIGTLSPAFDASLTSYTGTLPFGTITVPTVSATGKDGATVTSITQPVSPTGTATVDVKSADGSSTNTYTITFTVGFSSEAALSDLKVGSSTVSGFSSTNKIYSVTLPHGTSTAPTVSATGKDGATVTSIVQATILPGTATVTVKSADNSTTDNYSISFTVAAAPVVTKITVSGQNPVVTGTGSNTRTYQYTATILDQYDQPMSGQNVTWSATNMGGNNSISSTGLLRLRNFNQSSTTITARIGTVSGTLTVTVNQP